MVYVRSIERQYIRVILPDDPKARPARRVPDDNVVHHAQGTFTAEETVNRNPYERGTITSEPVKGYCYFYRTRGKVPGRRRE